jgi:hypothetical protein
MGMSSASGPVVLSAATLSGCSIINGTKDKDYA